MFYSHGVTHLSWPANVSCSNFKNLSVEASYVFDFILAQNIMSEQGKTLKDARNEMLRGLEVVEHACGMTSMQMEPLGVCAGICPSNFPALVPLLVNLSYF